ncbi:MAG: hypothetical protein N2050_04385 [Flavobacteriales bacterium]|nr:hypothetical protein [Flavobacteriales bacterium]MCX7649776.1 hypothetical protein [Flavobacteriales bacterium]MDW8432969.1 hypothetical protein [Flavobacteriales bacterium]
MEKITAFFTKKRIRQSHLAAVYAQTIFEITEKVFPEIADFLNHQKHFQKSPGISAQDQEWFTYLIFAANILNTHNHLPQEKADDFKLLVIREVAERFSRRDVQVAEDILVEYEKYVGDLLKVHQNLTKATAMALFYRFGLNECQQEHYQKLNQPDPVFFKQLCEMVDLLFWNWKDFLTRFRVV